MTNYDLEFRKVIKARLRRFPLIWKEIKSATEKHKDNKRSPTGGYSKSTIIAVLYSFARDNDIIIKRAVEVLAKKESEVSAETDEVKRKFLKMCA